MVLRVVVFTDRKGMQGLKGVGAGVPSCHVPAPRASVEAPPARVFVKFGNSACL